MELVSWLQIVVSDFQKRFQRLRVKLINVRMAESSSTFTAPRTCTRPNERWNACASECLAERCDDLITKPECYPDPQNCQPQCVCREEYYRNMSGFCVPKEDCRKF